jgi:hypothetical protein
MLNLLETHRSQVHRKRDGEKSKRVIMPKPLTAALVARGLVVLGRFFQFFVMFMIVPYDFIDARPEFCSIVSYEIGGLQRLGVFVQFFVALRIGIRGNSFLLTSR